MMKGKGEREKGKGKGKDGSEEWCASLLILCF
jgi:hypothetical protein